MGVHVADLVARSIMRRGDKGGRRPAGGHGADAARAEWEACRAAARKRRGLGHRLSNRARSFHLPAAGATPPPWTYDPPPERQIRPISWGRSVPDDDPDDYGGRVIHEYDPIAEAHEDDS